MRLLAVLLAVSVLLPSACLLWFMAQAVRNERLAVQQKLIDAYTGELALLEDNSESLLLTDQQLGELKVDNGSVMRLESFADIGVLKGDGMLIFDETGGLMYPVLLDASNSSSYPAELAEAFSRAWHLEFTEKDYAAAISCYDNLVNANIDDTLTLEVSTSKLRCLQKAGRLDDAIELCQQIVNPDDSKELTPASVARVYHARVLLANLHKQKGNEDYAQRLFGLLAGDDIGVNYDYSELALPSDTRLFVLNSLLDLIGDAAEEAQFRDAAERVKRHLAFESLSASVARDLPATNPFADQPPGALVQLADFSGSHQTDQQGNQPNPQQSLYTISHDLNNRTVVRLIKPGRFESLLAGYVEQLDDTVVACRIVDQKQRVFVGVDYDSGPPFVSRPLPGEPFSQWNIELTFKDADVFEHTAKRQRAVYVWAAVLVIGVIIIVGVVAGRVVGRQVKLNRLKNDFIATVSHELKTPLASMRVLVDTLLEGRYNDQQQVEEYLQLVAKENARLSRLIDNFLTFSRMERNKQSFDMNSVSSSDIAHEAAEATKTKLQQANCQLNMTIADAIPPIIADRDAIVTVLVNLLDNACKYGNENDKRVWLNVYERDSAVCFAVKDNGIGLSRRSCRRIFSRFYQVDQSLARSAEGCGLGLSIVEFILDAHKGVITVDSRLSRGSTFTATIPAAETASGI